MELITNVIAGNFIPDFISNGFYRNKFQPSFYRFINQVGFGLVPHYLTFLFSISFMPFLYATNDLDANLVGIISYIVIFCIPYLLLKKIFSSTTISPRSC